MTSPSARYTRNRQHVIDALASFHAQLPNAYWTIPEIRRRAKQLSPRAPTVVTVRRHIVDLLALADPPIEQRPSSHEYRLRRTPP